MALIGLMRKYSPQETRDPTKFMNQATAQAKKANASESVLTIPQVSDQQNVFEAEKIFRRLAHFAMPPITEGRRLPDLMLGSLIEQALFLSSSPLTTEGVKDKIKQELKLDFAPYEIDPVLKSFVKEGSVVVVGGRFSLAVYRRTHIEEVVKKKENAHSKIVEKFKSQTKERYPDLKADETNMVLKDFQTFLALFFLWSGADAANFLYGTPQDKIRILNEFGKRDIFAFLPPRIGAIREIERKEFPLLLGWLSDGEKEFFQDLLDKALQYFSITLDKKCEALIAVNFHGWKMAVDTNFIYNLLGLNSEFPEIMKRTAEELLKMAAQFGISLFVTPVTLDEFVMSVGRAKEFLEMEISHSLLGLAEEMGRSSAIISAYYREREITGISPRDFLISLDNIRTILKAYGISERRDHLNAIRDTKELKDVRMRMELLTSKDIYRAEHDSFHYLLVLKLRRNEGADDKTPMSNKSWFLTYDHILPDFDRRQRGQKITPFAIHPYQLRRLLRPFLARADDFEAVFVEFISRPESRAFTKVPVNLAGEILSRISFLEKKFNLSNVYEIASGLLVNSHLIAELRAVSNESGGRVKIVERIDAEVERAIHEKLGEIQNLKGDAKDSREYMELLLENRKLKWVLASLLWFAQVIFNYFFYGLFFWFLAQYFSTYTSFLIYIIANGIIFFCILAIPSGKSGALEKLRFIEEVVVKIKNILTL